MNLANLVDPILKIQEISKTQLCCVHIGIGEDRYFSTFQLQDGGRAECIATEDDGRIFAGFSLFKAPIAIATSVMVEKLSLGSDETNKFKTLRGAWHKTFTVLFNEVSKDFKMKPLVGDPTLLNLLFHFKGPCDINHIFLAPDGSPLLSKDTFLNKISQYTEDTRNDNSPSCQYSNANYILIALFIELVSGLSLAEFLRKHVFEPLGMNRTYTSAEEFGLRPDIQLAKPHTVSSNGTRRLIHENEPRWPSDTLELAVLGGYICPADFGKLFEKVLEGLYGKSSDPIFDKEFCESLVTGMGKLHSDRKVGYTRFGLLTGLHDEYPGSHSLNRLVSSDSDSLQGTLGKAFGKKEVDAYYMAGCGTGWLHTAYFLPNQRMFIIVLTNTIAPVDTSDVVSRLCLQQFLDLRPPKFGKERDTELYREDYVVWTRTLWEQNTPLFRELENKDDTPGTPTSSCANLIGRYTNEGFGQTLNVTDLDGMLGVYLEGASEISQPKVSKTMRFVRIDRKPKTFFRICSPKKGVTDLAIDCFGDWKTLEFEFKEDEGGCFIWRGANLTEKFTRV